MFVCALACAYCQEAEKERDEAVTRHQAFFDRVKQRGGIKKQNK